MDSSDVRELNERQTSRVAEVDAPRRPLFAPGWRWSTRPVIVVGAMIATTTLIGVLMALIDDSATRVGMNSALLLPVAVTAIVIGRPGGLVVLAGGLITNELLVQPPSGVLDPAGLSSTLLALLAFSLVGFLTVEFGCRVRAQRRSLESVLLNVRRREGEAAGVAAAHAENARTLLRMVSHELRTPLTTIQLGTLSLVGSPNLAESDRATVDLVLDEARRLENFIDNIVSMHRIESGELCTERTPFDLSELVRDVVADIETRSPPGLAWNLDATPTSVPGDAATLRVAVRNLVENAARHAVGASTVWVTVSDGPPTLRVRDDGAGLSGQSTRLVRPFQRGEGSGGLGLGLSLVGAIAKAHDGEFEIRDAPGGGAVAVVRLPESS